MDEKRDELNNNEPNHDVGGSVNPISGDGLEQTPSPELNDPEPPNYGDTPPSGPTPDMPSTPEPAPGMPPPPGPTPGTPPPPPPPGVTPGLPPGPPPAPNGPPSQRTSGSLTNPNSDEKNWAMFAHLSGGIVSVVLGIMTTIPFLGFLGGMVIYLIKKDESPYISDQAKEAMNFMISVGIVMFPLWALSWILIWTIIIPILLGILMAIVGVAALVFVIIAAIKASAGELYRYPFTLRLVK